MKRLFGAALAAVAFALACATPAPTDRLDFDNALYWRATHPSGELGELRLLGTIHVNRAPLELGPDLAQEFFGSDALVVEVDPENLDALAQAQLVLEMATLPAGKRLWTQVARETYEALYTWCDAQGVPIASFDRMKPWFAALTVELLSLQGRGIDPEHGLEQALTAQARAADIPIEELETVLEQMQIFDRMPPDLQERFLLDALDPKSSDILDRMATAWHAGDGKKLEKLLFADLRADPSLRPIFDAVYFERNARMVERLVGRAGDGRTRLVAVGAGHLLGEDSLQEFLRRRGWRVERVR